MVEECRLVADLVVPLGANLQQFSKFHDPHLGEFLTVEKFINDLLAFFGILAGQECLLFLNGWEDTGNVQARSTKESFIRAYS